MASSDGGSRLTSEEADRVSGQADNLWASLRQTLGADADRLHAQAKEEAVKALGAMASPQGRLAHAHFLFRRAEELLPTVAAKK